MRRRTWKILQWKDEPEKKRVVEDYPCQRCGYEADLQIASFVIPIALDSWGGLVADNIHAAGAMPTSIQCRHCRRAFGRGA